jgi:putative membrane protein
MPRIKPLDTAQADARTVATLNTVRARLGKVPNLLAMRRLNIAAAALVAATLAAPTMAADEMNDLEIAHTAYTAGLLDIRYAHLALALSENDSVREFARTMIRDHSAVNDEAVVLVTKLEVTPQDNDLSRALVDGAAQKRAELRGLDGKAFDCAYARNELGYHQLVNDTVENRFIPSATVPALKELLTDALVTFKAHEQHAQHMVAGLNCGA